MGCYVKLYIGGTEAPLDYIVQPNSIIVKLLIEQEEKGSEEKGCAAEQGR